MTAAISNTTLAAGRMGPEAWTRPALMGGMGRHEVRVWGSGQVKVKVHRMRARYRQLLETEIADTVCCDQDIADEIRFLFHSLS